MNDPNCSFRPKKVKCFIRNFQMTKMRIELRHILAFLILSTQAVIVVTNHKTDASFQTLV